MSPGYTLIPQAVWLVAPVVFYFGFLKLVNTKEHQDQNLGMKEEG
jgi:hypothetical protein